MKVLGHFNHAHAPNGTTTLVLNPRGPRRAALGSGPLGLALGPRCHEIGSVTPELGSEIQLSISNRTIS